MTLSLRANYNDDLKHLFAIRDYEEIVSFLGKNEDKKDLINSVMEVVSLYSLANFGKCGRTIDSYLKEYPYSPYKDLILYYKSLVEIEHNNYKEASKIINLLTSTENEKLRAKVYQLYETLANFYLSKSMMQELLGEVKDSKIRSFLESGLKKYNILCVMPLSGKLGEAGTDFLNGMKFSLEKETSSDFTLNLQVIDSKNTISELEKKVVAYLENNRCDLIVGELSSEVSAALGGLAALKNIPMIAPTASDFAIPKIGSEIFQTTTPNLIMGRKIANYAVDKLNYKTFATLAPVNREGREAVKGFIEVATDRGCEIISQEWYYEPFDLNKQLKRIREQCLGYDTVAVADYMEDDSLDIYEIKNIDAFFLPIPEEDIKSVIPQIAYYNFNTKFLGTYGFANLQELSKVGDKIDSLVFVDQPSFDINSEKYLDFSYKFRDELKKNPPKLSVLGYDIMTFIREVIKVSYTKKREILTVLNNLLEYDGLNGKMIFRENERTNSALNYFLFKNKNKKIQEINYHIPDTKSEEYLYFYNKGQAAIKKYEYLKAIENLEKARVLNDSLEIIQLELAKSYLKVDSVNQVKELMLNFLLKDSLNSQAYSYLGEAYSKELNLESAKEYYEKALELSSKNQNANLWFGNYYLNEEVDFKKALRYFRKYYYSLKDPRLKKKYGNLIKSLKKEL